jgi:subfamily B ATP-binding cassette protein MsbA
MQVHGANEQGPETPEGLFRGGLPEVKETRSGEFRYGDSFFFVRFARPFWKLGAVSFLLAAVATCLSSLLPLSSKVLLDFVVMGEGFERVDSLLGAVRLGHLVPHAREFLGSLNLVVLSLVIIGAIAGTIGVLQRYLSVRFQYEVTFNLQTSLFNRLLRFPVSFFRKRATGYLMSRVSDDIDMFQTFFSQSAVLIAGRFFYAIFGIVIVFALNGRLAVILCLLLPMYGAMNRFFAGRVRRTSVRERESTAKVAQDMQEVISGVETVKAYVSEDREGGRVTGSIRSAVQLRLRGMLLYFLSNYFVGGFQFLSLLVIMWFGVAEIERGMMTIGDFVAFMSYVVLLSGAVKALAMYHIMLQPAFASMGRLSELFHLFPEEKTGRDGKALAVPDTVRGEVAFNEISFSYEAGRPVLSGISFTAGPGEVIALVGKSGAGKTTLINLLLRFYAPESGAIYLDGRNIREISPDWLRQQIGVVSQEIFLFNDSIENNIKYGSPSATREEVIRAARLAGIHDEISGLPDTYDAEIGERGVMLSVGQRQRISIARAFLKNAPILVLDEPASALDAFTEGTLKESIGELTKGKTTFIIAHRLSLTDMADKVLVLHEGRITEAGTPQELVRGKGLYYKMIGAQKHL